MQIESIRDSIVSWAIINGVFENRSSAFTSPQNSDPSLNPFEDEHLEYFRNRRILKIDIQKLKGKKSLVIHTRQVLAQYKRAALLACFENRYQQSIGLVFSQYKFFKVDQNIERSANPIFYTAQNQIACGSSVGLGNQRNAGTLTALGVKNDRVVGISCNHVTGGCNTSQVGVPIVVPGIQDVNPEHAEINVIGVHDVSAPMVQGLPSPFLNINANTDVSVFEIHPDQLARLSSQQGQGPDAYDTPSASTKAKVGMTVKKWGRTSGYSLGEITAVTSEPEFLEYNVTSYYGPSSAQSFKGVVYYKGIIEVETLGNEPFSKPGDSGALVVTSPDSGVEKVVGILIGGSTAKSYVLPLAPALKRLRVDLLCSHN